MKIWVSQNKLDMARAAATDGASHIRDAIATSGHAAIILATGASQFEMLDALLAQPDTDWSRVTVFHLDEYFGLPVTHPASFRRYLQERFIARLPVPPATFHALDAETDPPTTCQRVGAILAGQTIDVAFIGIGENAHLAFNDPPADFDTDEPFILVKLDEACRQQQLGEGWFPKLSAVPKQAITMSIRQIMKSRHIVCTVPDERKAEAVRAAIDGPVSPEIPASILQTHPSASVYLDPPAASLLR
ncbi:MAG: glucosamine-6-phosphate deaminase [Tepidisphaeraceae bacterium]|jgi:glucosamine-6-phosphate deaminase